MNKEEMLEVIQYSNAEERDKVKEFFTNPPDMDLNKKTIVFSTPSETGTSFFRLFEPMRSLFKLYPDEANYLYTENLQPNHVKIADVGNPGRMTTGLRPVAARQIGFPGFSATP